MAYNWVGKFLSPIHGAAPKLKTSGGSGVFFGRTAVSTNGLLVAATGVQSNSVISVTLQSAVGSAGATVPPQYLVASISPGVGFWLSTISSLSPVSSYTAMWQVFNP